jgi:hypothetical protein
VEILKEKQEEKKKEALLLASMIITLYKEKEMEFSTYL